MQASNCMLKSGKHYILLWYELSWHSMESKSPLATTRLWNKIITFVIEDDLPNSNKTCLDSQDGGSMQKLRGQFSL